MNLHIKTKTRKLILFLLFTPMLFADVFPFQTIEKANEAYKNGEYRKSVRLFKSVSIDDPTVQYDQANAEYKAGMYDDALKHYVKAKGVDEATRLYNMGNCYFKKGEFGSAISNYRNALKLNSDDDVMHNLKLAREKRAEKAKKEREEKEKKDKDKKKSEEQKKKEEERKKKEEEQRKKDEAKKKESDKKDDKKKESDRKNSKSQKDADASNKQETKKKMSPKEKMRKKELSHLVKQLSKKKMPTMMYQGKENKGERDDKNPW